MNLMNIAAAWARVVSAFGVRALFSSPSMTPVATAQHMACSAQLLISAVST